MRTGKGRSEGQAFHRRLLSEYNTEFTLDNYVSYFELKSIAKSVEQLRKEIDEQREVADTPLFSSVSQAGAAAAVETLGAESGSRQERRIAKRHALEDNFFAQLRASFEKVKKYLSHLEEDLLLRVQELKQLTEEEIRARPEMYIPKLYVRVQAVLRYRALNLAAFRKIMKKFRERCACDSLELQKRLMDADDIIYSSAISQPRLDLRRIALDLIALYGTVYRLTYEETVSHLSRCEHQAGVNTRRILPHSETFFFTLNFPHQERQGDFAVRILPGNTSLFCEKMICEVLQCPRYPPCCGRFSNGEISVTLQESIRGDDVFVLQSLVKCDHLGLSHSATLMELALMLHTARLSSAARITAVIPYLAYANSVSSMALVAEILEAMGCQHVITVDMSVEQVEGMFSVPLENISARYEFVRFIANQLTNEGHDFRNITVVAPTGTSVSRAKHFADALMDYKKLSSEDQFVSVCTVVHRHVDFQPAASTMTGAGETAANPLGDCAARDGAAANADVTLMDSSTPVSTPLSSTSYYHGMNGWPQQGQRNAKNISMACSLPSRESSDAFFPCHVNSTQAFEQALQLLEEGTDAIRTQLVDNVTTTDGVVLVGDVKDRLCIIVDTVVDEAIKLRRAARKLHEEGATRIILIATHFILSGGALERLVNSPIDLIVVTDSINQDAVFRDPRIAQKLRVLPIAPLLARAVEKMHTENSLATLFES